MGEATAHRLVASVNGLARRGGHEAVEAVAVGVRAGRFCWPAMKKDGKKKGSGKQRFSFRRVLASNIGVAPTSSRTAVATSVAI